MLGRLTVNTSQACNLDCSYCYAEGGSYGETPVLMDEHKVLSKLMHVVQKHDVITLVQFIGGEPLLNLPAIRVVCETVNSLVATGALKKKPHFGVVTNLTVVTEKHIEAFKEFDISVTVSIDGPDYIHDKQRPKKKGFSGTHSTILDNLKQLELAGISYDFEATYTRLHLQNNVTFVDLLEYFSNWKPNRIDITPVSVPDSSGLGFVSEEEQKMVVAYQLEALNYALDHLSKGHVVPFGYLSEIISLLKSEGSDQYCPAEETNLAITSDGEVYGCHMFTNKKEYRVPEFKDNLGRSSARGGISPLIGELENEPRVDDGLLMTSFPTKSMMLGCRQCWARKWCRACLGNMNIRSPGKPVPFSLSCESTKRSLELVIQMLPAVIDDCGAIYSGQSQG